jgi:hypothetical protein
MEPPRPSLPSGGRGMTPSCRQWEIGQASATLAAAPPLLLLAAKAVPPAELGQAPKEVGPTKAVLVVHDG